MKSKDTKLICNLDEAIFAISQELNDIKKFSEHVFTLPFPRITIFGSSRISEAHNYTKKAELLAYKLARSGCAIITGAGPGIMKAANCGSLKANNKNKQTGISIKNLEEHEGINICIKEPLIVTNIFTRKLLMTYCSNAFVFFPGGYGTLDEVGEVLNLMIIKRIPVVPIILFGKEFWEPFMQWLKNHLFAQDFVATEYQNLITITDDIDTVISLIKQTYII